MKHLFIKLILPFLFMALSLKAGSQSLYEIKFRGKDDTTRYTCFLVYYNENDSYMRIGYFNKQGDYRVVDVRYKGETGKYSNGESYFSLTGKSVQYITTKTKDESYNPDFFVWIGNEYLPYTTDVDPDQYGKRNVYKVDSYIKVDLKSLTKTYLRSFYGESEGDYLALLKMSYDNKEKEPVQSNYATTLHLIVLANTNIYDIGAGCERDMNHLDNEFGEIAKTLNISYDKRLVYGYSFSRTYLLNAIDNMIVSPGDIVVFVYRGHGFRWSNQTSNYPSLALTKSHTTPVSSENTILLETVYNKIIGKGGRLNIVMADCCNSNIGINQWTNDNYLYMQSNASAEYNKLYDLFMNRKGNLLFAASEKGEVSWTNSLYGGFFTTSFLQALAEETSYLRSSESSWINIVTNTRAYALYKSSNCTTCTGQHAISYNLITKRQ